MSGKSKLVDSGGYPGDGVSDAILRDTEDKPTINFDRLEWYAYILKRALANREPLTAWDACTCIVNHFDQVYGVGSQERQDERSVDSFKER